MRNCLSIFIILLLTFETKAQSFQKVDSIISHLRKSYNIKGIGIVGVRNGEIIYLNENGIVNPTSKFTDSTMIYIASNTKAFIAFAVNKLVSVGKLDYDSPISNYIEFHYFPTKIDIKKIKLKDLLSHTHGLSNDPLVFRTAFSGEYPDNLQELLKFTVYRNDTLSYEFKYSNLGYLLAGIIIKNITGLHWSEYVQQNIFLPLQMNQSGSSMNFNPKHELLPYDFNLENPLYKARKSENTLHAAGGILSTLGDMGKWLSLFTDSSQNIFSRKLVAAYLKQETKVDKREGPIYMQSYSNGWIFGDLILKKSVFFHFGRFKGYESIMSFDTISNSGVFIIVNERFGGTYVAALVSNYFYMAVENNLSEEKLLAPILDIVERTYSRPVNPLSSTFSFKDSKSLCGTYVSDRYGTLLIDKLTEGYIFKLGKMESLGYSGEKENEIIVEWTPGIIEHLFIKEISGMMQIQYDKFDLFEKK